MGEKLRLSSLGEQEIEREGSWRRRWRRSRGRWRDRRGLRTFTGRQRTVVFFAQRRARRRSRRRGDPGARRRVERTLAPACCKSKRCRHGGHQGQPAPSVDGLFHLHPTLSPRLHDPQVVRTIPDRQADASVACMNPQVSVLSPIFSFRPVGTTISLPEFGHFSEQCRRNSCGSRQSVRPITPGTHPW
jgi:hypothetical protein